MWGAAVIGWLLDVAAGPHDRRHRLLVVGVDHRVEAGVVHGIVGAAR